MVEGEERKDDFILALENDDTHARSIVVDVGVEVLERATLARSN